ncbi:MAG TPA: tetratricopeptide repeat protein [Tepidisphaeraceae bacterium]|nr:tetratricopeptide repeat protein [Tepidisphaeraceae bacterium]
MTTQEALDLGAKFHAAGHLAEAEKIYRLILAQDPRHATALHLLGVIAIQAGQNEHAEKLIRQAIAVNPMTPAFYSNLCAALHNLNRCDEAIDCGYTALKLDLNFADAWVNLGQALQKKGSLDEAIGAYRRALELKPRHEVAVRNMLLAMQDADRKVDGQVAALKSSVKKNPKDPLPHRDLGCIYQNNGQIDLAVQSYRRACELDTKNAAFASDLLAAIHFHPDYDSAALLNEARQWDQCHAQPLARSIRPHANDRTENRRLRIGYVASEFRDHPVGRNILPLLRQHDRRRVEVFCYADVASPDAITEAIRKKADVWRDIHNVPDARVAGTIREDGIDILVDLMLHMNPNRLLLFARKPAPIQATFIGYPGGTGMKMMDYRLTDPYLDPEGSDRYYVEKSIRLTRSFWCYDVEGMSLDESPPVAPLPALKRSFVTFGSLNNPCKINASVIETWSKILHGVQNSRLFLLAPRGTFRRQWIDAFASHGIPADRIEFAGRAARQKYLQLYDNIDLGLDTFPYNGHTTSLDSLWMGAPIVTLVGKTVAGRAGLSQMTNLDLKDFIATTPDQFIQRATKLAQDLPALAQLRSELRQRMKASPLMDAARFARDVEAAYRKMWRQWIGK